jgi:hypothetical protein
VEQLAVEREHGAHDAAEERAGDAGDLLEHRLCRGAHIPDEPEDVARRGSRVEPVRAVATQATRLFADHA